MQREHDAIRFTNFNEYITRYCAMDDAEQAEAEYKDIKQYVDRESGLEKEQKDAVNAGAARLFYVNSWASYPPSERKKVKWLNEVRKAGERHLRMFMMYAEEFEQAPRCLLWVPGKFAYIYLGNPDKGIIVLEPERYMELIPAPDYSGMTVADMRMALEGHKSPQAASLIPQGTQDTLTVKTVSAELETHQAAIKAHMDEMERTRRCETPELAEMKAEIAKLQQQMEEKKQALMAELNEKLEQMEELKFQMEGQIYLLESQIYSIRCYTGETVKFAQLKNGTPASREEPIVIHQKLRFLDEELGRMTSLYYIQWEELDLFEEFLRHHPAALDVFAPNERCVVLVRLSRNNKQIGMDGDRPYQNLLKDYEYYHGATVGIIIRNGENLYLGWTDSDRIHIDDDLIISQVITEVAPAPDNGGWHSETQRKWDLQKERQEKKRIMDGLASRSFVYSILQGVVDNTPLLPLPDGVKLNRQSQYVIYSVADKWLADTRFGSFNDIVDRANATVKEGDLLLTTQRLMAERDYSSAHYVHSWNNVRGRGDANRTHDVHADDCRLYPANLVEYDEEEWRGTFQYTYSHGKTCTSTVTRDTREEIDEFCRKNKYPLVSCEPFRRRHVFISLQKTGWSRYTGDRTNARANFELKEGEYINVSNLSSVELEWAITNKSLGSWHVGGKAVDFAFAVKYLNHALQAVREREEAEEAVLDAIDPSCCTDPDWPLKLVLWKLETGVRNITPCTGKRFIRYMSEKSG